MPESCELVFAPLGDCAVTARLSSPCEDGAGRLRAFVRTVNEAAVPGVAEAVAGGDAATVYYHPWELYRGLDKLALRYPGLVVLQPASLQEALCLVLEELWSASGTEEEADSRLVEIPVIYGGSWGPDLDEAARLCGLPPEELAALHCGSEYTVRMIGFVPGFPYLGGLPQQLHIPRLATPRVSVPEGSVALGGGMTGIYPLEVPAGWAIIGRTPLRLFQPEAAKPSLLQPGDRVRFVRIQVADWPERGAES